MYTVDSVTLHECHVPCNNVPCTCAQYFTQVIKDQYHDYVQIVGDDLNAMG